MNVFFLSEESLDIIKVVISNFNVLLSHHFGQYFNPFFDPMIDNESYCFSVTVYITI